MNIESIAQQMLHTDATTHPVWQAVHTLHLPPRDHQYLCLLLLVGLLKRLQAEYEATVEGR